MFFDRVALGLRRTQGDEKRLLSSNHSLSKRCPFPLSSRPKRTRISCHAAPDKTACAPFFKERRMMFANDTTYTGNPGYADNNTLLKPLQFITELSDKNILTPQ
jgi:hypothetical protein